MNTLFLGLPVLKCVVPFGTFALAMAFAGNLLYHFTKFILSDDYWNVYRWDNP